jgi:hypothetical protein
MNAAKEKAQRMTNNVTYTNPKTASYLTISRSYSHWQGRTAGIVRGNNESTKRRFNRSAKAQKMCANLDLLYCEIILQNKCFVFAFSLGTFRYYIS